jgi:hypothetical protein
VKVEKLGWKYVYLTLMSMLLCDAFIFVGWSHSFLQKLAEVNGFLYFISVVFYIVHCVKKLCLTFVPMTLRLKSNIELMSQSEAYMLLGSHTFGSNL